MLVRTADSAQGTACTYLDQTARNSAEIVAARNSAEIVAVKSRTR